MKLLLLAVGLLLAVAAAPRKNDDEEHELFEESSEPNSDDEGIFRLKPGTEVPESINWVEKGAVTSVKNQGACGSCYAFSAVGALEGLLFLKNKTLTDLSSQELVDCSRNNGCAGGFMNRCFKYVKRRPGIDDLKSYPYIAEENFNCRADEGQVAAYCSGYKKIPKADEKALQEAVGTVGPVSAGFAVDRKFARYKGGVYDGSCADSINHGVLVVGYGTDNETGVDYWLVKNSWGVHWGENGYFRLIRNKNKCSIATAASFPVF